MERVCRWGSSILFLLRLLPSSDAHSADCKSFLSGKLGNCGVIRALRTYLITNPAGSLAAWISPVNSARVR